MTIVPERPSRPAASGRLLRASGCYLPPNVTCLCSGPDGSAREMLYDSAMSVRCCRLRLYATARQAERLAWMQIPCADGMRP